jgi:AcrR family transcriptional regulator
MNLVQDTGVVNTGRRARNRAARHKQLIGAAGSILAEEGLGSLTMQAVADRVDCAVGTIYTYFNSKSALLAALQSEAIRVLTDSYDTAAERWDGFLDRDDIDPQVAALSRILGLGRLFLSWPDLHPREFDFLQMLLVSREEIITIDDAMPVVPQALMLLSEGRVLIDAAVDCGALRLNPDLPGDDSLSRTLRWAGGLDGAVLVSAAGDLAYDIDPGTFDRSEIGIRLTIDLLSAWGARADDIHVAMDMVDRMNAEGNLIPRPPAEPADNQSPPAEPDADGPEPVGGTPR